MKSCFLLFFRTYPNCPLRNYLVKYAEFSWDWSKGAHPDYGFIIHICPTQRFLLFCARLEARLATWDSAFRYFTAAGQYFVDGGAFWWLFTQLDVWIPTLMSYVPDWLQWLSYLLWPLAVISVLLVFGYFFSTIANWIAAPFNGLLAEQLEARLTGATPPDTDFRYHERYAANHETRMAKICLVSAARNCIANSLLHPWYWANRRAGTLVPV